MWREPGEQQEPEEQLSDQARWVRAIAAIAQTLAVVVLFVSGLGTMAICSADTATCDPSDDTRAGLGFAAVGAWLVAALALAWFRRRFERRDDRDAPAAMLLVGFVTLVVQLLALMVPLWSLSS